MATAAQMRQEIEQLRDALDRERTARIALEDELRVLRKVAYAPTTSRSALLAAAREEAMRTGRVVKV
jgi:hypothetical protein